MSNYLPANGIHTIYQVLLENGPYTLVNGNRFLSEWRGTSVASCAGHISRGGVRYQVRPLVCEHTHYAWFGAGRLCGAPTRYYVSDGFLCPHPLRRVVSCFRFEPRLLSCCGTLQNAFLKVHPNSYRVRVLQGVVVMYALSMPRGARRTYFPFQNCLSAT